MKKLFLFSFLLSSFFAFAQTALWGISEEGGTGSIGTIYKTNPDNTNPNVVYSFASDVPGKKPAGSLIEPVPGFLFGMTSEGGIHDKGVIYKYEIANGTYTKLFDFDGANGAKPLGSLYQAGNGFLYGLTSEGGTNDEGVLFMYDPIVDTMAVLHNFTFATGIRPEGSLIESGVGTLYGLTYRGGVNDDGVLFEYNVFTNTYTKMLDFDELVTGQNPAGSLISGNFGRLYGTCFLGGANGTGTIFSYTAGAGFVSVIGSFSNTLGFNPLGELCYNPNNDVIYGTCSQGGAFSEGTIFIVTSGTNLIKLYDFDGIADGGNPEAGLIVFDNNKLLGNTYAGGPSGYGTTFTIDTSFALTFTVQSVFDYFNNGAQPKASFFKASDGNAYLPSFNGGSLGEGVFLRTNTSAANATGLLEFNGPGINGGFPTAKLIQATDGFLYGATKGGGSQGDGVVYKIDPTNNTFTKVADMDNSIGKEVRGKLVQANGSKLYGMAYEGGQFNFGSIFEIDITVAPPVVPVLKRSFSSALGTYPLGGLSLASNGKIYGTTSGGGTDGDGVLFEYDPLNNNYLIRHSFTSATTGSNGYGNLVQLPDGRLVGLNANGGGAGFNGVLYAYQPLDSSISILHTFATADGTQPQGSPVFIPALGKIFGVCFNGGANNKGTIWSYVLSNGIFSNEHDFDGTNGQFPKGELSLSSTGNLYGTTTSGGTDNAGVAFEFNPNTSTYLPTYGFDGSNGSTPYSVLLAENCNNLTLGSIQTEEFVCTGDTAIFNAAYTGGSGYQWFKDGVAIAGATQATYTPNTGAVPSDAGFYHVTSYDACGYKVNPPIKHQILSTPIPDIINNGPLTFCQGQNTFSFSALNTPPGLSYQWLFEGNPIAGANGSSFIPQDSGAYSLVVTNQAGCDSVSQTITFNAIDSVPGVNVSLSTGITAICGPSLVTFTASAPLAGTSPYFIFLKNGTIAAQDYLISQNLFVANGDVIQILMQPDTCASNDSLFSNTITIIDTCQSINLNCSVNLNSVCTGGDIEVSWTTANAPSVSNQYVFEISDASGSFANPTNIGVLTSNALSGSFTCSIPSSLPSGNGYRVRVNTTQPAGIGSDNGQNIILVNNNFNLSFTANPSTITNPNRTTTFSNNTPNSSTYDFFWYFGDGVFQADNGLVVSHTYPNNGVYIPSLVAVSAAGCSDTLYTSANQVVVNAPGSTGCGFPATTSPSGTVNGCQGGTIEVSYAGSCTGCTYQWNRNGVPLAGGNSSSFDVTIAGFYSLTIIDTSGCLATTAPVNIGFGQPAAVPPVISASGNIGLCAGGVNATLSASGNYAAYVWSNGATGNSINITQGGTYFVYGQGSVGCDGASLPFNVSNSVVQPIEICMVSATDDNSDNIIIWDGPLGVTYIDNFIILREDDNQTGVYNQVGTVPYADSSQFTDVSSDPNLKAYRYKLAIQDSCGGITLSSTPVRSMYLQIQPYIGVQRLLSWNQYQGQSQNIARYLIYSGNSLTNLNLIDSVNAPGSFYVDASPDFGPNTQYRVEARLSNVCQVVDRATKTTAKSNSAGNLTVLATEGMESKNSLDLSIFPNPANDKVYISFSKPCSGQICIEDLSGRVVQQFNLSGSKGVEADIELLSPGMYLIRMFIDGQSLSKKIIKR